MNIPAKEKTLPRLKQLPFPTGRSEQLEQQRRLAFVPCLDEEDTLHVLKAQPVGVIILLSAHTGKVLVPDFQFDSAGSLRSGVRAINLRLGASPQANNGGWEQLAWWADAEFAFKDGSTARPIQVVTNWRKLQELVHDLREIANER